MALMAVHPVTLLDIYVGLYYERNATNDQHRAGLHPKLDGPIRQYLDTIAPEDKQYMLLELQCQNLDINDPRLPVTISR